MEGGHGSGHIRNPFLDPHYPSYSTPHPSWIPRAPGWQRLVATGLGSLMFGWMSIMLYKEWDHVTGVHPWDRNPDAYRAYYPKEYKPHH
ncbi:hypothetical protein M427DRAFT_70573 [Gonapodya prolifera JEL478]|uniref:Uncharacterized protein n=1 Tax=Gonapodya prolifera (strain JEL478) TaxID=1344416 RepID=A0A139ACS2_GONPJ|nr:hypothetical protein M427DRAFT_70573 [Gonapodya prolifera JEL478]|eukprot:KXS14577.1 hypothetical protein M427DRAFT_70573 [Gonapodya prolifera JEL478]